MIVSADTVTHLADGLIVSFPVVAVAYFAEAGGEPPDEPSAAHIAIPTKWRRGWRRKVLGRVHHYWVNDFLALDERAVARFDRGMILGLGTGLPCSLAARVVTDQARLSRILVAAALLVLVLTLNAMLVRAIQKAAVRQNVYARPRGTADELGPFHTLERMTVTLFIATAVTAAAAVLLATST